LTRSRLFVCSGAKVTTSDPLAKGRYRVELDSIGPKSNVHISFENVAKVFQQDVSPRLIDFLEIAAYVFSADCSTARGTEWADNNSTEPWTRDLAFVIPVRHPEFWEAPQIKGLLEEVLNFLSNDIYSFHFELLKQDRVDQQYFEFGERNDWPFGRPERVVMFSGGLDSLSGAVEAASAGTKSVLVSHRSAPMLDARQRKLFADLQQRFPNQFIHVPVWINKAGTFNREPTQRTRSFLYSALGTLVAQSVQAGGVRFYENGIVSLNLPIAQEAIRARASRTTHPIALHLLESLCAAVTERTFVVDNPFIFKTKKEVVETLAGHKAADLIADTCSCSHLMFQSKDQRHCGRCSQCIDRRFATTAAGLLAYDSDKDYAIDVFLGPRNNPLEKAIAADYALHGIELHKRSEEELAAIFNTEISRAVRYEPKRGEAAQAIIAMHKRHGETVTQVLEQQVTDNRAGLIQRTLDKTSLLALAIGQEWLMPERQIIPEPKEEQRKAAAVVLNDSPPQAQLSEAAKVGERLVQVLGKISGMAPEGSQKKKKRKLTKADTVMFAAIILGLESTSYCAFLDKHGVRPNWSASGPSMYSKAYRDGEPWRKKIQDQKTRAKHRMSSYSRPELADAIVRYLPEEFDRISPLLNSRNSPNASKSSSPRNPHKN
jgi:hypothetical protein